LDQVVDFFSRPRLAFVRPAVVQKVKKSGKKQTVRFTIDCTQPVEDEVLDVESFEKFLKDRIKVNGKAGVPEGGPVSITCEKTKLVVTAELPFSKRYLKYLSKKYLKKLELRDYLRVVANSSAKNTYELKYFSITGEEGDEEA